MDNSSKRIEFIDFLKVLGLFLIMVPHVEAPGWALMGRAFDVQLLVILSATLAKRSIDRRLKSGESLGKYWGARVVRLVTPAWIFLSIYFALLFIKGERYSLGYYRDSFLLSLYGIGYVWIILVYIFTASWNIAFYKMKSFKISLIVSGSLYILCEVMLYFGVGEQSRIFVNTFYYIFPYGFLTLIGFFYNQMGVWTKRIILASSTSLFVVLALYYKVSTGSFQPVYYAAFPPRAYFLSYGIMVSMLLMMLLDGKQLKIFKNKFVIFMSRQSMWIYLWHILMLKIFDNTVLFNYWYLELIVVFVSAVLIAYLQYCATCFIKWKMSEKKE